MDAPPLSPSQSRTPVPAAPRLIPAFGLRRGRAVILHEGKIHPLEDASGGPADVFDVADELFAQYRRAYLVDFDGIQRGRPQLDFMGEIGRNQELWVEAGPRTAEEVMDILVAGASKAVLATPQLKGAVEISRTLKLTTDVALLVLWDGGAIASPDPQLRGATVDDLAREARQKGLRDLILASTAPRVDWELVERLAPGGPTYVGSPFRRAEEGELLRRGAHGGIFPAEEGEHGWTISPS